MNIVLILFKYTKGRKKDYQQKINKQINTEKQIKEKETENKPKHKRTKT